MHETGRLTFNSGPLGRALVPVALSLVCLTGGCPDDRASKTGADKKGKPVKAAALISRPHLEKLERELLARARRNKTRRCPRALLRGEPLKGPADRDQLALIRHGASSGLAGCKAATLQLKDELGAAVKMPGPLHAKVKALLAACDGLSEAVQLAVRHEDACSPYLPGRRGLDDLTLMVRWSQVIAIRVRRSEGAEELEAARLGLDTLRLSQDLVRGGGSLVAAMIGVSMAEVVSLWGMRPLLDRGALSAAQLEELDGALAALEKSEPPFGPVARDLNDAGTLQHVLPLLKGKGWVPPGGFDHGFEPNHDQGKKSDDRKTRTIEGLTRAERVGLVWIAGDESSQLIAAACPVEASTQRCWRGLASARATAKKEQKETPLKRVRRFLTIKDRKSARVRQLVDVLKGVAGPDYSRYVGKFASRAFHLRAMRLHVRLLREKLRTKRCPTASALLQAAGELGRDPFSGKPLRLAPEGKIIVIQPSNETKQPGPKAYVVQKYWAGCPG